MRIRRNSFSPDEAARLRKAIDEAALAPGLRGRVCGEACLTTCTSCGSTACQCGCSPQCIDVGRALSSDPEGHPIEGRIIPLVYALTKVGLFATCWSCEGHERADGVLTRAPTVWFGCDVVHARLLADGVASLHFGRRLKARWQVVVSFSDPDNPQTTFALEPAPHADAPIPLRDLQSDAATIAQAVESMMVGQARSLRRGFGAADAT